MSPRPLPDSDLAPRLSPVAARVLEVSIERWGAENSVDIIGRSSAMRKTLESVEKLARFREPVLIRGESGVGKECVAQALYLLGSNRDDPFVVVNCPRYRTSDTTVSELFGHAKGSFTGATCDHRGLFERAQGGLIFLDEIADLPMSAQTMLLRTLASGEIQPLGAERSRKIDVRTLAATNRSLNELAADDETFRRDLLWRLQFFRIDIPPLRERGEDWLLLIDHALDNLARRYGERKRFSTEALRILDSYDWPGNVRELLALTTASFALADGDHIEVCDLPRSNIATLGPERPEEERYRRLEAGEGTFWTEIQKPYLDRELNRSQVRELISRGLRSAGAYLRLLERWGGTKQDYQRFMDFLRHHRLKPEDFPKP
ncbi:MAG: sigma 54-interacting transcriptional regulator [Holophagales bacterium]|nr:sigma 54-interacting transcriptional regulator [Holophagales bacterium]